MQQAYKTLEINLFAYCQNDPLNETDYTGNLLVSIIKKIFAGVFEGFIKLLGSDLISFFYNILLVDGNTKFVMSSNREYLKAILSAVASRLTGFARNKEFYADILLILNPYIPKFANGTMKKEDWHKFALNLITLILKNVLLNKLDKRKKRELEQLKKYRKKNSRNIDLKRQKRCVKINFDKKGVRVSLALEINEYILENFLNILAPIH